jgi:hypothetical protein
MTILRHIQLTTAAVSLAAVAAVPAHASMQTARFYVTAEGKQDIHWSEPKHSTYKDCYNDYWTEGKGSEHVDFRAPRTKLLVTSFGHGIVQMQVGSWNPIGTAAGTAWLAKGSIDRSGSYRIGADVGTCGTGGRPTTDTGPYDCGRLSVPFAGSLALANGKLSLLLGLPETTSTAPRGFARCPMKAPDTVAPGGLTPIGSALPARDLLNPAYGKLIVLGHKDFEFRTAPGQLGFGGVLTSHAEVRWTVTLTRVKRNPVHTRRLAPRAADRRARQPQMGARRRGAGAS